jgi:SNF2 family DNA or RNA helicase
MKVKNHTFKKYIVNPGRMKEMSDLIYKSCIRFTKDQPQIIEDLEKFYGTTILTEHAYHVIKIKMNSDLQRIYNEIKQKIWAEIKTEEGKTQLTITCILTKLLRLQQVTSGFIANGKIFNLLQQPKLDAAIEEIESIVDAEESCIIWCRFRQSMNLISAALAKREIKHYYMSGDDSPKEKEVKWRGFQSSLDTNVFVGQIKSGGIGIELFKIDGAINKSQHTIFYENEWTLEVREQAEGRIDRIGQKSLCRYVDIIVENTIDEILLNSIRDGQEIADKILRKGVGELLK